MKGRTPKPPHLKLLAGNPGKRPINTPPELAAEALSPPDWLSPAARAEWQRLAPELARLNILSRLDLAAFARYCTQLAQWTDCQRLLAEEGLTYKSGSLVKRHPAAAVAADLSRSLLLIEQQLGLTPQSRQRLDVKPAPRQGVLVRQRHSERRPAFASDSQTV